MKIIAIVNQKGGVGKTTTAVTLAHGLARHSYRVLLVDLDAQGNVADALGLDKTDGLYQLLIGSAGSSAVVPSGRRNLNLILGDKTTAEARTILAGRIGREKSLRQALSDIGGYDVAILDVAPGVDLLQVSAFVAATHVLIPVALDALAVVGAGDALGTIATLKEHDMYGARFLGVLPTFWERTTNESHEQLKLLVEQYQKFVWPPIPQDVKAREAPAYGKTLWEHAPGTRALDGVKVDGRLLGGYARVLTRLEREVGNG